MSKQSMSDTSIHMAAVKKAIGLLTAAGAQYKVVYKGETLADTLPAQPEPKKKHYFQKTKGYTDHFREDLKRLDTENESYTKLYVPVQFEVEGYRGAVAAFLNSKYGPGSCITKIDRENRTVEVLLAR
jgi:hypothetical protein